MGLTKKQELLLEFLMSLHIEKENMYLILCVLKTEEELMEMMWYLHDNWKTTSQSQIMDKMVEIYDRTQQSKPGMTEAANHE